MDIKTILKDTNFINFMNSVSNMKLDIFETVEESKAFGITRSKFRICYDKVISNKHIYDNCYAAYKQAMTHLNALYASYTSEFATIDEFAEGLFDKLKTHVGSANVLPSNNIKPKRTLNPAEIADYEAKRIHYIEVILTQVIPTLNNLTAVKALENANIETLANFVDETEAKLDSIITEFGGDITDQQTRTAVLHEYLVSYLPESYINGDNLTTQKIEINKTRFDGHDPKYSSTPEQLKTLAFLENFILAKVPPARLPKAG